MNSPRPADAGHSAPPLCAASSEFESSHAIETYLDRLNRRSPMAQREIVEWGPERAAPRLRIKAIPLAFAEVPGEPIVLAESQLSFGLDVRARRAVAAGAPYSVALVLSGSMRVSLPGGEFVAQAGEGVIIDPSEVEGSQFSVDSHFVEFALPRSKLLRLGAELAPGELAGAPGFAPVLHPPLAQRLLFIAREMAHLSRGAEPGSGAGTGAPVICERWMEMVALSLLHEQQFGRAAQSPAGAASPRSLSRALDYIDANAQADILLADIAQAACISVSSLLRQFNEHFGQSPGAFLRQLRLDRARAELRRGWPGTIRELAQRWGFQSAGKFSQAYLRRFGERPSDERGSSRRDA